MLNGKRIGGLLLMGGTGQRFGSEMPKQFHRLSGKPVYQVTLEAFQAAGFFDEIVLSCHPDWMKEAQGARVIAGGATRQESSYKGLLGFGQVDIVLIHDAVRPFVSVEVLRENALLAIEHGAVDTCIRSADTLVYAPEGKVIESIPNRAHYLRGQTPQSFQYSVILKAHEKSRGKDSTDDCRLVLEMGHPVWVAEGDEHNLKITSELDLFLAEQLFRLRRQKVEGKESIAGKVYAVVGGSGGIGTAICQELEMHGAKAISLSRKTGLDLRNPESIEKVFQELGPVDGLINAAGVLKMGQLTLAEINEVLDVNLKGLILCCQKAEVKSHIINIASSSFMRGRKDMGVYSCTKAGVVNFTQSLAEERPNLRVHAVIPQRTRTQMRLDHFPEESDLLEPEQVAKTVVQLLMDFSTTGMLVEVKKHVSNSV